MKKKLTNTETEIAKQNLQATMPLCHSIIFGSSRVFKYHIRWRFSELKHLLLMYFQNGRADLLHYYEVYLKEEANKSNYASQYDFLSRPGIAEQLGITGLQDLVDRFEEHRLSVSKIKSEAAKLAYEKRKGSK